MVSEMQGFEGLLQNGEHNRKETVKRRDFTKRIEAAVAKKVSVKSKGLETSRYRSKKEKIIALGKLVKEEGLENLDSTQLMQLFSSYREIGASEKMIEIYSAVNNPEFKTSPVVLELLADAYYKRSFAEQHTSLDARIKDREEASNICFQLIKEGKAGAVAYSIAGKCFSQEGKREEEQKMNEAGFKATLDPFLGLQAVQYSLKRGNLEHAKGMAKIVYLASLRDGAEESNDFYAVSAALQAACVAGESKDKIGHLCERLSHSVKYTWQLEEFNKNIDAIRATGKFDHETAIVKRTVNGWKMDKSAERSGLVVIKNLNKENRAFGNDEKLEALHAHSYNYRGCGSDFRGVVRVGGNMEFGGQLPSHTVSKKDLELFAQFLQYSPRELKIKNLEGLDADLPLAQIDTPEKFMVAVDRFVRQGFMTDNFVGTGLHLEENALSKDGNGKSSYDYSVIGVLEECGKKSDVKNSLSEDEQWEEKKFVDTRTNITAIFALGMGDCRHHAQVKQIMFDMYQRKQMDAALRAMLDQTMEGQEPSKGLVDNFYHVLNVELRTADIKVMTPVKMHQTKKDENGDWVDAKEGEEGAQDAVYRPVLTEGDKKFTVEPDKKKLHNLEEHTLCWLIRRGQDGKLESMEMRDAFYQERHYGWGCMSVDIEKDIALEKRTEGGKTSTVLKVRAGKIPGSETNTGEDIEVYQEPTDYNSGRREQEVNSSIGEDIRLVGMQVKGFENAESVLGMIHDRDGKERVLKNAAEKGKAVVEEIKKEKERKAQEQKKTQKASEVSGEKTEGMVADGGKEKGEERASRETSGKKRKSDSKEASNKIKDKKKIFRKETGAKNDSSASVKKESFMLRLQKQMRKRLKKELTAALERTKGKTQ